MAAVTNQCARESSKISDRMRERLERRYRHYASAVRYKIKRFFYLKNLRAAGRRLTSFVHDGLVSVAAKGGATAVASQQLIDDAAKAANRKMAADARDTQTDFSYMHKELGRRVPLSPNLPDRDATPSLAGHQMQDRVRRLEEKLRTRSHAELTLAVLRLMADGLSQREMKRRLEIGSPTLDNALSLIDEAAAEVIRDEQR